MDLNISDTFQSIAVILFIAAQISSFFLFWPVGATESWLLSPFDTTLVTFDHSFFAIYMKKIPGLSCTFPVLP